MDSITVNLPDVVQTPPQDQVQTNSPPDDPLTAPPTIPEDTETQRPPPAGDANDIDARAREKQRKEQLTALGKTFGHIPDVPIFTEWPTRKACCDSAVHRSVMAGICGNPRDGAYSIVLSGLYSDDEDGGDIVIYTGAGGRKRWTDSDPPKRIRMGPQTEDQSWDNPPNGALKMSSLTGNPVRVVRSWRCLSPYASAKGYRYDGLYKIAVCWTAKGRNGKDICRCRLERLPNQPPLPVREITLSASRRSHTSSPSSSTNSYMSYESDVDVDTAPIQSNPSLTQLAGIPGRDSEGLSTPPQQQPMHKTSAGIDFDMDEDVKDARPPPSQRGVPPNLNPGALQRYRWDPKNHQLVRVPFHLPEDLGVAGGEQCRGEDDATLVPSDDGHVDDERMETEYFSDRDNSPRPETLDEPRASAPQS
ncbi:PUA-like domain-containing protein [Boletus coccyginus]|nr:PUA-like domain-containing protein [Boletus coccyginus]